MMIGLANMIAQMQKIAADKLFQDEFLYNQPMFEVQFLIYNG